MGTRHGVEGPLLVLLGWSAIGCAAAPGGGGPATYEEYECPPPMGKIVREDCTRQQLQYDGTSFHAELGAGPANVEASYRDHAIREADALVSMLKEQKVSLCNNFNTCKMTVAEYRDEQRRLDDSFVALLALKDRMRQMDAEGAALVLSEIRKIRTSTRPGEHSNPPATLPQPVKAQPVKAQPVKAQPVKPQPVRPEPASLSQFLTTTGVDWPGNDILFARGKDAAACAAWCAKTADCVAFALGTGPDAQMCWLKSALANPMKHPHRRTYVRKDQALRTYHGLERVDFPGNDLAFARDKSAAECARMCADSADCAAFVMGRGADSGQCWLKSKLANRYETGGRVTYCIPTTATCR